MIIGPIEPDLRNVTGLALPDVAHLPTRHDTKPIAFGPNPDTGMGRLLKSRRTTREYSPLAQSDLSLLLSTLVSRSGTFLGPDGYIDRFRSYPSAGGRHPHTLLVLTRDVSGMPDGEWVVDENARHLLPVRVDGGEALRAAVKRALGSDQMPPATVVTLARRRRTTSKYPGAWGESLVWRDAGVLLGTLHLIAHDAGLASAILGISGSVKMDVLGSAVEYLTDTGAMALGNYQKG